MVLLHGYPYHRQAAWPAQAFPQVYADVGPFGEVLFSTDAYGPPEPYAVGGCTDGEARRVTELLSAGNARRPYGI